MRNLILILVALIASMSFVEAQTTNKKEEKAKSRKERKAERERADSLLFEQAKLSIENKCFVLEADRVMLKRGMTSNVSSNTNFVMVNKEKATVQVSFNVPVSGANGLGGVTVDGNLSDFKIKEDKKGNLTVDFNVSGAGISAKVTISLPKGSNSATLNVLPTFNSNHLTLYGQVMPLEQSTVFKGRTLF